ncbi:hypothetical protein [Bradyrhizobium lupini]|uniref:hypothetical protein n=1 Tax=Rhizobium lupini TaxID=136996 RepID=UPI0034C5CD90
MTSDQHAKGSFALVGEFLHRWSQMEQTLHLCVSAGTKLDALMNTVVCANLTIREKLNIVRTLVDISSIEDALKADFKKLLRDIGDYSTVRNMLVHDPFMIGEDAPAVYFMTVKAKGSFDTPGVLFDEASFRAEYRKIKQFTSGLEQVAVWLENSSFSPDRLDIPMRIVNSPARPNPRARQPSSDPNNPKSERDA